MEKVLRAEHFGRSGRFPLTQEELAEFAGASRATVNRVLLEEQARGTLELQRVETRNLDPDELARRAGKRTA